MRCAYVVMNIPGRLRLFAALFRRSRRYLTVMASMLALVLASSLPARASEPCVDVALVLAVDGSNSVDAMEWSFQKRAIAASFRDQQVLTALAQAGVVSVSVVYWGDGRSSTDGHGWIDIATPMDAETFASQIEGHPRKVSGSTGLAAGLNSALAMLTHIDRCAHRKIINVSSDGEETVFPKRLRNTPSLGEVRTQAEQAGVSINAIVILEHEARLLDYYASMVVVGPDAFVMEALGEDDYADALRRKLIREIAPLQVSRSE